jgi:hypothetical protein
MMLPLPDYFPQACLISLALCIAFGSFCSIPSIWDAWFPKTKTITYLKAGEYGEVDNAPYLWSVFKEPINAWTSLLYAFFAILVVGTGIHDLISPTKENSLTEFPGFSIVYGLSGVYLGVASFLFHASHAGT